VSVDADTITIRLSRRSDQQASEFDLCASEWRGLMANFSILAVLMVSLEPSISPDVQDPRPPPDDGNIRAYTWRLLDPEGIVRAKGYCRFFKFSSCNADATREVDRLTESGLYAGSILSIKSRDRARPTSTTLLRLIIQWASLNICRRLRAEADCPSCVSSLPSQVDHMGWGGCLESDVEVLARRQGEIKLSAVGLANVYAHTLKRLCLDRDPLALIASTYALAFYTSVAEDIPSRDDTFDRLFREAAP
jgi:hypothetical protein